MSDVKIRNRQTTQKRSRIATPAVQNFFHHDADNVGDQMCGPSLYFEKLSGAPQAFRADVPFQDKVVFGGGQVFKQMDRLSAEASETIGASLVAWGAGVPPKGNRDEDVMDVAARFELFGVRNFEWSDTFDFVPCVSCMSPAFNDLPEPEHDVVVFRHQRKVADLSIPDHVPSDINVAQPLEDVARFIASGETVVTTSYHGVYWAQLLGRKVICVPYNNKFGTFEHAPHFSTPDGWMNDLHLATQHKPLLNRYRSLNMDFYRKVSDLWGLKGR